MRSVARGEGSSRSSSCRRLHTRAPTRGARAATETTGGAGERHEEISLARPSRGLSSGRHCTGDRQRATGEGGLRAWPTCPPSPVPYLHTKFFASSVLPFPVYVET